MKPLHIGKGVLIQESDGKRYFRSVCTENSVRELEVVLGPTGKGFVLGRYERQSLIPLLSSEVLWVGKARTIIKILPGAAWVRYLARGGTKCKQWNG